ICDGRERLRMPVLTAVAMARIVGAKREQGTPHATFPAVIINSILRWGDPGLLLFLLRDRLDRRWHRPVRPERRSGQPFLVRQVGFGRLIPGEPHGNGL